MNDFYKNWKPRKERPICSGNYIVANENFTCISTGLSYSKKYDLWGVTDDFTKSEIEEYKSIPIVAELMRGDTGWWKE